jgi:WD40 repeat protein
MSDTKRSETKGSVQRRDNPYFGLDYYEEKFGSWFFGRETEGSKIITNLRAARLTLLHAESGVGKSSLLRAGVAWRMRRLADDSFARRGTARSVPIVFSSWKDDPVLELAGAVRTAIGPYLAGRAEPELPTDRLDAAIEAASDAANAGLLIMLDQFEEYFLYRSREPTPERFADELARCINRTDLHANFLIAIREDAYAGLGDLFKGRIANVYSNYLHVEYLDRASAEKAIREPLEIYNDQLDISEHVKIQDELVEAVLDQVRAFDSDALPGRAVAANGGGRDRVATPLLQLVMETVWQRARAEGSHELRLSTLQDLRGVKMIVDAHLGKALNALGSGERQTAIDMFDHLVTPSGGKIAESVPDLAKRTGHSEAQVGTVLDKLDRERIVRPIPAAPGQDPMRYRRYEIFHDVLAPTINRAIAAREERRRARRLRRFAALAVGLLAVALALVGVFISLLNSADTERLTAESRQLAAEADVNAAHDPELSLLLAWRALRLQDTSQAEDALRGALPESQAVRTFRTRTTASWAVFDPVNSNEVVSAGKDGSASIWDVKAGRRSVRLWPKSGFKVNGTADAAAFNQAGTQVAVGYGGGTVVLFDASKGKELRSISVGPTVNDVRFIGGTGGLAIATQNGVRVWLPGGGLHTLSHAQANTIAVDPQDPLKFAVATTNGTVIWNMHASQPTHRYLGVGASDAEFSPDGREVVTADNYGSVWIYNLSTFQEVMLLRAGEGTANSAAFSQDGKLVVSSYKSGTTLVWDAATGLKLTPLAGNASTVYTARFSPTGSEVVTASGDGTIRVWQAQPRELRKDFATSFSDGTPNPVYAAQYSPGGGRILVVDNSYPARVFTDSGKPVSSGGHPIVLSPDGGAFVEMARFNQAGTEIVTADSDGTVDLWHASGSDYTQIHPASPIQLNGPARYADFSPDGSRIAVVTNNYTAQVFSSQTGQLLRTLNPKHYFSLSVAVFSNDGRQILTGDKNGQVEVWNASTGHKMRVLGKPGPAVNDVEFNKSGSKFVTASDSGVVTVWNARSYRQVRSINACPSPSTASFSPDGSKIVVACGNGGAPVFATATGQQLTVLEGANVGEVNSAAFSPDGKSIVTTFDADNAGGVRIWSSELATTSLPALERLAKQRVTGTLTPSERQQYLTGISG